MSTNEPAAENEWCFPVKCAGGWGEVRVPQNGGDLVITYGERANEWLAFDGISIPPPRFDLAALPMPPAILLNNIDLTPTTGGFFNDRYIYHYTCAETALTHILPDKRLRMSKYPDVNDPRESKEWAFSILCPSGSLAPGEALKLSADLSVKMKGYLRMLCFSTDGSPLVADSTDLASSSGWNHPSMWYHYAGKYKGIVLVFDRRKLLANAKAAMGSRLGLFFGHVMYLEARSTGANIGFMLEYNPSSGTTVEKMAQQHLNQRVVPICFVKHEGWSVEQECRLIALGTSDEYEYVPIDGAIAEVIVGSDADTATYDSCKKAAAELGVGVSVATWRNGLGIRVPATSAPS